MGTAEQAYRKIAFELRARALKAPTDADAFRIDALAQCYLRLAEQAEQNSRADIWAEFGPKNPIKGEGEGA
jgi:hypothetical protein